MPSLKEGVSLACLLALAQLFNALLRVAHQLCNVLRGVEWLRCLRDSQSQAVRQAPLPEDCRRVGVVL